MRSQLSHLRAFCLGLASFLLGSAAWLSGGVVGDGALADGAVLSEIEDIRVGENEAAGRLVIVCGGECAAEEAGPAYQLYGVTGDLMVDLAGRGGTLTALSIEPNGAGAELTILSDLDRSAFTLVTCGQKTQICIDFLKPDIVPVASANLRTLAEAQPPIKQPSSQQPPTEKAEQIPAFQPTATAKPVALDRASLKAGAPAPLGVTVPLKRPTVERTRANPAQSDSEADTSKRRLSMDTKSVAQLTRMTGLAITPQECGKAQTILKADAWDLTAYRRFALCVAAAGQTEEAYGLLTRLEKYQPDDPATRTAKQAVLSLSQGEAVAAAKPKLKLR